MKRYRKRIIIIICILLSGVFIYKQFIQIQNIFDQMYYTRIRTHYDWWGGALGGFGNKADSFSKMPQIKQISRDAESNYTVDGYFTNGYKEEYLSEGESLVITFDRNEKTMEIIAVKRFNEFDIIYRYTYDIKKKQLTETVECDYGEIYNENPRFFREHTKNPQEILLIIEKAGLTKEDLLQYKKYFLYDKLLTDWVDGNLTRFSANRWGRVEYTEALPLVSSK
ncbi:TipC family immunity protein [Lacrimispora brassicae]